MQVEELTPRLEAAARAAVVDDPELDRESWDEPEGDRELDQDDDVEDVGGEPGSERPLF